MSFRQLSYVIELAEAGSFRQAAENLNITHAALVQSIRSLEEQYGMKLFDRGRGVKATPTKAGEIFIRHSRNILLHETDMQYDINILQKPGLGELNLVLGPFPIQLSGKMAINKLIVRYPDLKIKVSIRQYEQVKISLLKRQANIAVAELSYVTNHPELITEPLGNHISGFFCRSGHPLLQKKHLIIDDLLGFPWCCTKMPSRVKEFLPPNLGRAGRYDTRTGELVPAIEVDTMCGLNTLIKNTDVLCAAPLVMFKQELIEGELILLPFHDRWIVTNYGFVMLKNRSKPPAVVEFMNEVQKIEKELFQEEHELATNYFKCAIPH